ncbi:hypothetical protein [Chitinophaga nivalis]|uniref:SLC26A/SulP transporter domain-containing protein n=1 Tax=Chitinophaga nivalis TaxID=2991709 RepID=A0ABT3ITS0_9BACT|nr:hypothetical protein [Chitinophaga nivalis]MCW3462945.1 hypothetical protein [Chitinophaga nivalis]MCW3487365.1 hypothetical protein [Chitinophaga nivalis]
MGQAIQPQQLLTASNMAMPVISGCCGIRGHGIDSNRLPGTFRSMVTTLAAFSFTYIITTQVPIV